MRWLFLSHGNIYSWVLSNVVRNWQSYRFYLSMYLSCGGIVIIKNTNVPHIMSDDIAGPLDEIIQVCAHMIKELIIITELFRNQETSRFARMTHSYLGSIHDIMRHGIDTRQLLLRDRDTVWYLSSVSFG